MENPRGYPFISRVILASFVTLLLIAGVRIAKAAPDPCWEKHTLAIRFDTMGVTAARKLKDDELRAASRWVNSQEPVTDIEWQTIILAELPDGSGLILVGREEAVCTRLHVPAAAWLKVRLQMLGIPV